MKRNPRIKEDLNSYLWLGIDGEGQQKGGRHIYVFLAAVSRDGTKKFWVENQNGLSTLEVMNFFMSLPDKIVLFSYAFNYDITKIINDLPDKSIYKLLRPELRRFKNPSGFESRRPVWWRGFKLDLQGTKFTIGRGRYTKPTIVWDIFRFFQGKFVDACEKWDVGTKEQRYHMQLMKDKRSEFDKVDPEAVKEYCFLECQFMAELAYKLIQAHQHAGLTLKQFYGAGSSASAMLDKMNIQEKITRAPEAMKTYVASAFFGGRFENLRAGINEGRVYNYDISSAYPYQLCFLPCLQHGTWIHTTKRHKLQDSEVRTALVRYTLGRNPGITDWGPFPFRTHDGSICFPIESGGGCIWLDEYLIGEKLFPHVQFKEAWVYKSSCQCQPFKDIPHYYLERLRLGKEAAGIVLKLGMNSVYGKLAQSIGQAQFNSWVWAGLITSGTRAQLLELLGLHANRSNLLMTATDGIYTKEKINVPVPRDTGTGATGKPLGGWEEKIHETGIFLARPGIYFPLNPTEDHIKTIKGRGVGGKAILNNWKMIIESYQKDSIYGCINLPNVTRFCGAKTSISFSQKDGYKRADYYGEWKEKFVQLSFHPMPKREGVNEDGTLTIRRIPKNVESMPYDRSIISLDRLMLEKFEQEMLEQPDNDYQDYPEQFME